MNIEWQIYTNAKSEAAANTILEDVSSSMAVPIAESSFDSSDRGGFVINLKTAISEDSWSLAVVRSIAIAQKIARTWHLSGDIESEVDAWSNEPAIPGLTSAHMILFPEDSGPEK